MHVESEQPINQVNSPELSIFENNPLLASILLDGGRILNKDPDFLEANSHPSGRHDIGEVDLLRSHGIHLVTVKDGVEQTYFDFSNHWFTHLLDPEKHEKLKDPLYLNLLGQLAQEKYTPTELPTPVQAEFVDMMQSFFSWGKEENKKNFKVLPVSAGAMAVSDAIDIAKGLVSERLQMKPQQLKGVCFTDAFHGRYDDAAEVTANEKKVGHKQHGHTTRVIAPIIKYNDDGSIDRQTTDKIFNQSMKETEKYLSKDNFAYVIIEYPIQAEGGGNIVNEETLARLHDLCKKYNKLLIVDCIHMGGRSWTIEGDFVSPFPKEVLQHADIVNFGKVFHANGTVLNLNNVEEKGLNRQFVEQHPLWLGGTHTSSLADMLSGTMIMKTILQERLWENALEKTSVFYNFLKYLTGRSSQLIGTPRKAKDTDYLVWSFSNSKLRDEFRRLMLENEHIILLGAGDSSIRIAFPPDMDNEEMFCLMTAVDNQMNNLLKNESIN